MNLSDGMGGNIAPWGTYGGCSLDSEIPGLRADDNVIYVDGVYGQHNVTLYVQIGREEEYLTADIAINCPEAPEEEF